MAKKIILFILLIMTYAWDINTSFAQNDASPLQDTAAINPDNLPTPNIQQNDSTINPIGDVQLILCILITAIGSIGMALQFYILQKSTTINTDDILKNFTISFVIFGSLLLVVAGYNNQQTSQAFGLFGTIVGYLLGKSSSK